MPNDDRIIPFPQGRSGKPNHVAASSAPPHPERTPTNHRATNSLPPVRGVAAGQPFPLGRGFINGAEVLTPQRRRFHLVEESALTRPQPDQVEALRQRVRDFGRWRWWSVTLSPLELAATLATAFLMGVVVTGWPF